MDTSAGHLLRFVRCEVLRTHAGIAQAGHLVNIPVDALAWCAEHAWMRNALPAIVVAMFLTACFPEDPVRERIVISFDRETGTAVVQLDVSIMHESSNHAVAERLERVRGELLEQHDVWSRRIEAAHPKFESYTIEKDTGRLISVTRLVKISPSDIGRLFDESSVQASYSEGDGWSELSFFAGTSDRATREQARDFNDREDGWARDIAAYLNEAGVMYAYLASHPERAELVFSRVFDGIIDEVDMPKGDLTDEESDLVRRLKEAMDRVSGIMAADEGKAYSVDEASRLVNDPFPAPVLVKLDGEILELEGFVRDPEAGGVRTKSIGLWDSLNGLRGRWLTPDPLMTKFEYGRGGEDKKPFSLGAFVALPRRATPPKGWREIRSAIDQGLKQVAVYRVRWVKRR